MEHMISKSIVFPFSICHLLAFISIFEGDFPLDHKLENRASFLIDMVYPRCLRQPFEQIEKEVFSWVNKQFFYFYEFKIFLSFPRKQPIN
jgi:hypothetical protein